MPKSTLTATAVAQNYLNGICLETQRPNTGRPNVECDAYTSIRRTPDPGVNEIGCQTSRPYAGASGVHKKLVQRKEYVQTLYDIQDGVFVWLAINGES